VVLNNGFFDGSYIRVSPFRSLAPTIFLITPIFCKKRPLI
jgi:hypothetical protein